MARFWRRVLRHPGMAWGGLLCAGWIGAAGLSLMWTPWPTATLDMAHRLQAPDAAHWLGTDSLGRDIASQLLTGAQSSLVVGVLAVGIGLVGGTALGLLAAARGGWVDMALMRACDIGFAFPVLLSALLLSALRGPGLGTSILAIGLFHIPVFARLARGTGRAVWARNHVLAARTAGLGPLAITRVHVLPHIAGALVVQSTIAFASALLAEAALSYLGLGTQAPQPSWGRMLADAQSQLFNAPQLALWPGAAIMLSVLGLNLMGDGLRDVLDPRWDGGVELSP